MKKNYYTQNSIFIFIFLTIGVLISSCNSSSKKNAFEVSQTFPENNWSYEQRILEFEQEIEASEEPFEITLTLDLADKLSVDRLPFTFSIYGPDGSESHKPTVIVFNVPEDPTTEHLSGPKTFSKVIYDQKFFNTTGTYKLRLLQKSGKYDLRNVKSVKISAKPTELKEEPLL